MKFLYCVIVSAIIMGLARVYFHRKNTPLDTVPATQVYNEAPRQIYELLFCDDLNKYAKMKKYFPVLFEQKPSQEVLLALANDSGQESRIRILAHRRLKETGFSAPTREVFGVIVEYNQKGNGLDTLAVYSDGNIRYINYTGKMAVITEPLPNTNIPALTKQLLEQAQQLAQTIGPWGEQRLPPPAAEQVRITLLVNGDIYFGQAPADVMQQDPLGAPLLQTMAALLLEVTQAATSDKTTTGKRAHF